MRQAYIGCLSIIFIWSTSTVHANFFLWAQVCVQIFDLVPQNKFVTLNCTILYKMSMKFGIQEVPWIPNFIDFLDEMVEWWGIRDGKHLIKNYFARQDPFLKISICVIFLCIEQLNVFIILLIVIMIYIIIHFISFCFLLSQDDLVTMHDVLDAQWQLDNMKDGMYIYLSL